MKWLVRTIGGLVALAVLLLAIGLLLPRHFRVERAANINAPAEKVYALLADPREWKRWTVWNQRDPAMKIDYSGPASGAGARWAWQSKTEGNGAMEFTEVLPNQRIGYTLSFPDFGMQSAGVVAIAPASAGVRVSWTNEGELGVNPVNRWFGLFMDRMVGKDFDAGLANLKRIAEAG
jgi:uncharacterized protein YndB with AHSA1/START domain